MKNVLTLLLSLFSSIDLTLIKRTGFIGLLLLAFASCKEEEPKAFQYSEYVDYDPDRLTSTTEPDVGYRSVLDVHGVDQAGFKNDILSFKSLNEILAPIQVERAAAGLPAIENADNRMAEEYLLYQTSHSFIKNYPIFKEERLFNNGDTVLEGSNVPEDSTLRMEVVGFFKKPPGISDPMEVVQYYRDTVTNYFFNFPQYEMRCPVIERDEMEDLDTVLSHLYSGLLKGNDFGGFAIYDFPHPDFDTLRNINLGIRIIDEEDLEYLGYSINTDGLLLNCYSNISFDK